MPHAQAKKLDKLFAPKSIAVLGASRNSKKIGNIAVRNLLEAGYKGTIFPVNPKASQIHGLNVYNSIADLPEIPDLAIIALPSVYILKTMNSAIEKGIVNFVIYTAGFKEIGKDGAHLEKELKKLVDAYNLNILGPNCLGYANTHKNINATFSKAISAKGNLKFISQSGAIAAALFDWAEYADLGFSDFVTLGNKVDVSENDLLQHWEDELTSEYAPVGMYLESIANGEKFLELAAKITKTSPIFALKPGKSEAAQHAMQSHTGALAGEDAVLDAALKQVGVIRCDGLQDLFDMVLAFSWSVAPNGPNLAIISNAGGPAVVSADAVSQYGLNLAPISAGNKKYLSEHLPRSASILNPIDVLGDALADRYKTALEAVLKQKDIDSILVLLTPQVMTEIQKTAKVIYQLRQKYNKPIFCSFIGGNQVARGQQVLNREKIPSYPFPENAIKVISNMWKWKEHTQNTGSHALPSHKLDPQVAQLVQFAKQSGRQALSGLEVDFILNQLGLDTPKTKEVTTVDEAKRFALHNGWPVVLKLSSGELLHKTDSGALITNIESAYDLDKSFEKLVKKRKALPKDQAPSTSIQIQKQIETGLEIIIGVKRDPDFGYVMVFGAGGIYTEILRDTNLRLLPLHKKHIRDIVEESKVFPILKGARGQKAYYLKGIYDVIEKVANLVIQVPEFSSFEINPVIVEHGKVWLVDGKATL